jgi:rSAM/selenodomain-associated transferase 2
VKLSVIIPAFNEAQHIAARVQFVREHGGDAVNEIIVVDGQSTDGTGALAEAAGARVWRSAVRSRAAQMNLGAQHATGDVFYFVHADVQLLPSFVDDIRAALAHSDAGCYRYVFDSPQFMLKINAWFTRFDRIMCRGGDQTLYVRRAVFEALNGFDEYYTIMEDYDFILRLRKRFRFHIIPKNVTVSARKYDTNSWWRVQWANLSVFMMFFRQRKPDDMRARYRQLLNYR